MENNEHRKKEVEKHIRVLKDKLNRFLPEEKASDILILKANLICEYYINQILILNKKCLSNELDKLDYSDKIIKAFDLNDANQKNIYNSLNSLNKLRNRVGHELEYNLSESDVDILGYTLGRDYILDKYDYDDIHKLLANVLRLIIIDVSLELFEMVAKEKAPPVLIKPSIPPKSISQ